MRTSPTASRRDRGSDGSRRGRLADLGLTGLAALALLVAACAPSRPDLPDGETPDVPAAAQIPDGAEPVAVETLLSLQQSGLEGFRRVTIRTDEEWRAFWREAHAGRTPIPDPPGVDFGSHIVIAASTGRRDTGGHSIAIDSVLRAGDRLYAVVRSTSPGEDCMVTQALTSPATAVRVAGPAAEVTFVNRESTRDC